MTTNATEENYYDLPEASEIRDKVSSFVTLMQEKRKYLFSRRCQPLDAEEESAFKKTLNFLVDNLIKFDIHDNSSVNTIVGVQDELESGFHRILEVVRRFDQHDDMHEAISFLALEILPNLKSQISKEIIIYLFQELIYEDENEVRWLSHRSCLLIIKAVQSLVEIDESMLTTATVALSTLPLSETVLQVQVINWCLSAMTTAKTKDLPILIPILFKTIRTKEQCELAAHVIRKECCVLETLQIHNPNDKVGMESLVALYDIAYSMFYFVRSHEGGPQLQTRWFIKAYFSLLEKREFPAASNKFTNCTSSTFSRVDVSVVTALYESTYNDKSSKQHLDRLFFGPSSLLTKAPSSYERPCYVAAVNKFIIQLEVENPTTAENISWALQSPAVKLRDRILLPLTTVHLWTISQAPEMCFRLHPAPQSHVINFMNPHIISKEIMDNSRDILVNIVKHHEEHAEKVITTLISLFTSALFPLEKEKARVNQSGKKKRKPDRVFNLHTMGSFNYFLNRQMYHCLSVVDNNASILGSAANRKSRNRLVTTMGESQSRIAELTSVVAILDLLCDIAWNQAHLLKEFNDVLWIRFCDLHRCLPYTDWELSTPLISEIVWKFCQLIAILFDCKPRDSRFNILAETQDFFFDVSEDTQIMAIIGSQLISCLVLFGRLTEKESEIFLSLMFRSIKTSNNALLGVHACKFLQVHYSDLEIDQHILAAGAKDYKCYFLRKDELCIKLCKDLLESSGLVQSEDYLIGVEELHELKNLSYQFNSPHLPELFTGFPDNNKNDSQIPKIVLCLSHFVSARSRISASQNLNQIENIAERMQGICYYVRELISTYIVVSKQSSCALFSIPWLIAQFQLPDLPSSLSNALVKLFHNDHVIQTFSMWDLWSIVPHGKKRRLVTETAASSFAGVSDVLRVLEIAWTGCAAVAACCALITQVFEPLKETLLSVSEVESDRLKNVHIDLFQFQIAKIGSLSTKVEWLCEVLSIWKYKKLLGKSDIKLNGLASHVRKLRQCLKSLLLELSANNLMEIEYGLQQTSVNKTSSSKKCLDLETLYRRSFCLELVADIMQAPLTGEAFMIFGVFPKKSCQLSEMFTHQTNRSPRLFVDEAEPFQFVDKYLPVIVASTKHNCMWLSKTIQQECNSSKRKSFSLSTETSVRFLLAHYNLIRAALLLGRACSHKLTISTNNLFFITVRISTRHLQILGDTTTGVRSDSRHLECLFAFFLDQLESFETDIFCMELLDILSLISFALPNESQMENAVLRFLYKRPMRDTSAAMYNSLMKNISCCRLAVSPVAFGMAVARKIEVLRPLHRSLSSLSFICELAARPSIEIRHLKHGLLTYWSFLDSKNIAKSLRRLFTSLVLWISNFYPNGPPSEFGSPSRLKWNVLTRRLRGEQVLQGLKAKTCGYYFEILQKMVAASIGSVDSTLKVEVFTPDPFGHINDLLALCSDIVHFYMDYCEVFPSSSPSCVLSFCSHVLKSCRTHLSNSVKWRTTQPLLTAQDEKAGKLDDASLGLLRTLCQSFGSFTNDAILFCCWIKDQARPRTSTQLSSQNLASDDQIYFVGESWIYTNCHVRTTSLLSKCFTFFEYLAETCAANNLAVPKLKTIESWTIDDMHKNYSSSSIESTKASSKSHSWFATLEIDSSGFPDNVEEELEGISSFSILDSTDDDYEDSPDTDSFGVMGNWGSSEDDYDDDEHDDDLI